MTHFTYLNIELWFYISIFLLGILCLFALSQTNWYRRIQLAFSLPGPKAIPIIGNCLLATDNAALFDLGDTAYKKYGSIFRVWISCIPMYVLFEPKDVQSVLGTYKNTEKTFFYALMHNFLGNGLITNSGSKWKMHRKLLQPYFNINVLETYFDTFSDSANSLIQKLKIVTEKTPEINITSFINNSVLDILNEAILGIPIKRNVLCDMHKTSPFRQGKVLTQDRIVKPWLLFDCIYNFTTNAKSENNQKENLNSFTRKTIEIRKEERKKGISKKDRVSLLERMLDIAEEHPEFSDDDIVNEVCTFMLAGQESVATTVSFCLYFIAKHEKIQSNILEELQTIFANSDRMPSMKDLNEMKYLEQCIKETMRLCPSVPMLTRKLGEEIIVGDHILPSGSNVIISPLATQRLEHIYPNPLYFDPSRFSPEEVEKRHSFSFIPFSAGPRNCIGYKFALLEMKTLISTLLRNYEISVKPGYELELSFRITLRAKGGIWLRFTPRV